MNKPADRAPGDSPAPDAPEPEGAGTAPEDASGIVVEVEEPVGAGAETDRVAELEAALAEAEAGAKENYDRLVRTAADLDNLRKRSRREVADARLEAESRVLREVLPVVDNLERAIAAAATATEPGPIREGVELVLRQLQQTLEKLGVQKISAAGEAFDPNLHEAVSQLPSAEHPPGTVVEVLQQGYTIRDRLLRAALAVVATAPPAPAEAEAREEEEEE